MADTEPPASPVRHYRRRQPDIEALCWDGNPEALEVLKSWGADPRPVTGGVLNGAVRIWGSQHGYAGAVPGDFLVRRPDGEGVDKWTARLFAAEFEPEPEQLGEPGLREALQTIRSFGPLTSTGIGAALNDSRPVVFFDSDAIEGWVCAVPDPDGPGGFCGTPVEAEACGKHGDAKGGGPS